MIRSLFVLALISTTAWADVDEDSAQRLAEEAQDDFIAGRFSAACAKLEISLRIKSELRPLGMLAACNEKLGKLATAWRTFKDLRKRAEAAGDNELASFAAVHVARLDPMVARLTIVAGGAPSRVDGLVITFGGRTLLPPELDAPFEVDAGTYQIVATAPGRAPWHHEIGIRDGKTERVEIPMTPVPLPKPELEVRSPPPPRSTPASPRRWIGIATAGAGGVAMIAGVALGFSARGKFSDAKTNFGCDGEGQCPDQLGVDAVDAAHGRANLATGFLIGGAALAAAGVVLFVTAPRAERTIVPVADRGGAGVILQGRF